MTFQELQQLRLQSKDLEEFKNIGKIHKLNFTDEETNIFYNVLGEMNAELNEAELSGVCGGYKASQMIFRCNSCNINYSPTEYFNAGCKCKKCGRKCMITHPRGDADA